MAQARLGEAQVRLRALRGLLTETVTEIDRLVRTGDLISRHTRGQGRLAAAHIVHESRSVIELLLSASGASTHFVDNPLQRASATSTCCPGTRSSTTTPAGRWPVR